MSRTLLVDGDTLIFSASSSTEQPIQWNEYLWTLHGDLDEAIEKFDSQLDEIAENLKADRVVVALSCDEHERWRHKVMPDYKANRKKNRKPVTYGPLREYCEETRETYIRPTLEGDDVLGILATHPRLIEGEKIIVAIDKDLKTIPGLLYNYDKARGAEDHEAFIQEITEEQADRFFYLQTLAGDVTDGYGGCPGVGMSTAEKLLDGGRVLEPYDHTITRGPRKGEVERRWKPGAEGTPWEIIVSAYRKAGLGEEVALMNARVARICRHTDWDNDKKEVILWKP